MAALAADIEWSLLRGDFARACLRQIGEAVGPADIADLWSILRCAPVRVEDTVYTAVMCPNLGYYRTEVLAEQSVLDVSRQRWKDAGLCI